MFKYMPVMLQNLLITTYNTYQYSVRRGGKYRYYRKYYSTICTLDKSDLEKERSKRLQDFLETSVQNSNWYSSYEDFKGLSDFPILEKSDIVNNLFTISTISEKKAIVSLTGGTTGASMKVLYSKENIQERNAILDIFREEYGYKLGKKCAWFSGKNIATEKNIKKGLCYRDDFINNIRFFSTFHINEHNFDVYWKAFSAFSPEFIVGFPSSVYEICSIAASKGLKLERSVKVFFPTAETLLPHHREIINTVLGCKIVNQYASSEGAPFILECKKGSLHIHPLTGIFEVVDEDMNPAQEGQILVTSFTTEGTPLIRYRIGDSIKLGEPYEVCDCGSKFPLVKTIEGRSTDFILSPTHGKVNLGNISNSTKGVKGIIQFQIIQKELDQVHVLVVASDQFSTKEVNKFLAALQHRLGTSLLIKLEIVTSIPKEDSGKFRFVKNLLK